MDPSNFELSPPQRLAVAYSMSEFRAAFALLLAFDERLGDIVERASEPMIAQMKFAWWYDAISRGAEARPKGEPMLLALSELSVPRVEAAMQQLLDAWSLLLAAGEWTDELVDRFANYRSTAIFGSYAGWLSYDHDVSAMGVSWASADLRQRFGAKVPHLQNGTKLALRTTRNLRPLSILALSVTNPSASKMLWHALTGR